jgi:hypothetical protein
LSGSEACCLGHVLPVRLRQECRGQGGSLQFKSKCRSPGSCLSPAQGTSGNLREIQGAMFCPSFRGWCHSLILIFKASKTPTAWAGRVSQRGCENAVLWMQAEPAQVSPQIEAHCRRLPQCFPGRAEASGWGTPARLGQPRGLRKMSQVGQIAFDSGLEAW